VGAQGAARRGVLATAIIAAAGSGQGCTL